MSISIADFWKLLDQSQLHSPAQLRRLQDQFHRVRGAANQANSVALAEWLIDQKMLTRYHARLLLKGKPGPFVYGAYKVMDRFVSGPLAGRFRGIHVPTRHPVTLDFLTGADLAPPASWPQVQQWAARHCTISHPHLMDCYEIVDLGPHKFVAGALAPGRLVYLALPESGQLPMPEACHIVCQLALGLGQLHEAGLCYGDVCLEHAWAMSEQDFAWLRFPWRIPQTIVWSTRNQDERLLQLADYAAPEMDRPGQCPNDLTDIYGLGCVLYRLLAGDVPFAGGGVTEKRRRHAGEPIQPLDRLVGIPPSLARLVATMMAKNPGVRVNSARHIAEQLTPLAGESSRKPVSVVALTKDAYLAFLAAPKNPPSPQSTAPQSTAPQSTAPQSTASGQSANADSGVGEMVVAPSVVSTRVAPTKTNRRQTTRLIVGATVVAAIVVGTLLVVMRPDVQPAHGPDSDSDPIAAGQGSHDGADSSGRNSVPSATADATVNAGWVPDDGQSLWRSPTAGRAIVLRYVPRGGQAFAVLRLHQMLEDSEGERMLRAFGPDFLRLVAEWQSAAGVTLDELECLTMVFLPRDNQLPELYFVAQLPSPTDLLQRWEEPAAVTLGSCNAYHRNGWTLSVPADSDGSVFVMGSDDTVREAMELRGAAPPLRRELEQLRMSTDDQRLVNVLLAPNFLFSDGGRLLQGPYAQLLPPLKNLFGDHTRGAAVGLHFDQGRELYLELRMDGAIDEPPTQLSHALEEYLRRLPVDVESFLVSRGAIDPYWQELALKFDNMVEFVCRNVRVGVEGREVVANVSLPKAAGHNLVLGTELALASHRSASIAEQPVTPPPSLRIEEILQTNVTLSFPQQSLEFAMQDLTAAVHAALGDASEAFQVVIVGKDLQAEGITRNQQIRDFRSEQETVASILTKLVMRANPVTTVTDPAVSDQKLIWVTGPSPNEPQNPVVLITTRKAASENGYSLPQPFRSQ